jgi:hypothetical protein
MTNNIEGKIVVITGASSGLREATLAKRRPSPELAPHTGHSWELFLAADFGNAKSLSNDA